MRQVKRRMLELQLAGFDLREIQDVVDDRQQLLAGLACAYAPESRCSAVELGIEQQSPSCPARRSWACGFRGSCWPGTGSSAWWLPAPRPGPPPAPRSSLVTAGQKRRCAAWLHSVPSDPPGTCAYPELCRSHHKWGCRVPPSHGSGHPCTRSCVQRLPASYVRPVCRAPPQSISREFPESRTRSMPADDVLLLPTPRLHSRRDSHAG